jgi:AraC family transcriptional activator of tynA and feaB
MSHDIRELAARDATASGECDTAIQDFPGLLAPKVSHEQGGPRLRPVRGLRLADLPPDEQEARWERSVSDQLVPMSIRLVRSHANHPNESRAGAQEYKAVADLTLARWDCPPSEGARVWSHIRQADPEAIIVLFAVRGTERISHGAEATVLSKRSMFICNSSTPVHFATDGGLRKHSLIVPRMAVDDAIPNVSVGDGLSLPSSRPLVRLLRNYLGMLWWGAEKMSAESCAAARDATVSLLAGAITTEIRPSVVEGAAPAFRLEMIRWIDQHLSSGQIKVAELASAHYVSERTVQRVFELAGETVSSVVRRRRMFHAQADLLRSSHPIGYVAARWGYYDQSHFGREFRYFYDCTPREFRADHAGHSQCLPLFESQSKQGVL